MNTDLEAADLFFTAEKLYDELRFAEALALVQTGLVLEPNSRLGISLRGMIRDKLGKIEESRSDFLLTIELIESSTIDKPLSAKEKKNGAVMYKWLGDQYWRQAGRTEDQGDFQKAADAYTKMLALDDTSARMWCEYGRLLCVINRPEDGIAAFRRSLEINQDYQYARELLAETIERLAEKHFRNAQKLENQSEQNAALDEVELGLALSPESYRGANLKASILFNLGETEQSRYLSLKTVREIREIEERRQLVPSENWFLKNAYVMLSRVYARKANNERDKKRRRDNWLGAAESLHKALDIDKTMFECWHKLGAAHFKLGQHAECANAIRMYAKLNPTSDALAALFCAEVRTLNFSGACRALKHYWSHPGASQRS